VTRTRLKITLWDVMPCSLVYKLECFGDASSILKTETSDFSENVEPIYKNKRCCIQEDNNLNTCQRGKHGCHLTRFYRLSFRLHIE
jgi:hypothetical protein